MKPLVRWSPFSELSSICREIDELFDRFFESGWGLFKERILPVIDSFYKDNKFVVRAELPGIDPKDLNVTISGNELTIKGERKAEKDVREEDYVMMERSCGAFCRTITLPDGVDTSRIEAHYHDGVLDITMPCEAAKALKRIPIEITHHEEVKKAA